MKDEWEFTPFISADDSGDIRKLKERCVAAMRRAVKGRVKNESNAKLAARISHFAAVRKDRGRVWPPAERKTFIKSEAASLGPALLQAAAQGTLAEVAELLDRKRHNGPVANADHYRVLAAYSIVLGLKHRPPFIAELLEQLGINKPRKSPMTEEDWSKVSNRERVIRRMITKHGLTLSEGKRGRRH
jgi:hypothetical protein